MRARPLVVAVSGALALAVASAACGGGSAVEVAERSRSAVPGSSDRATSAPGEGEGSAGTAVDADDPTITDATTGTSGPPDDGPAAPDDGPAPPDPPTDDGRELDPAAAADGLGDSIFPNLGNGGYDVSSYRIELDVDGDDPAIEAVATVAALALRDLPSLQLDLHGLEVASVEVDGRAATFERDGDELVVAPAVPVADGAPFRIVVAYGGEPDPVPDPSVPIGSLGWQRRDGVVFVASEPSGASTWFPANDHPLDAATFTVAITHDDDVTAISNGVLASARPAGPGRTTSTWVMDDPMATYLAAVYVGDFERLDATSDGGVALRDFVPSGRAGSVGRALAPTGEIVDALAELLDEPYPFAEYGSVVLPFPTGFALENQTVSLHGLDALSEDVLAHEIAHQWFGNHVRLADWQDTWIAEGFATYLSHLWFEERGERSPQDPELLYGVLERNPTVGAAVVDPDDLFGLSVYLRGALALHAVRAEVGDAAFGGFLAEVVDRFGGRAVRTDDVRALVLEVGGERALAALDPWLFDDELPPMP